jgi:hypothetical protein
MMILVPHFGRQETTEVSSVGPEPRQEKEIRR